MLFSHVIFLSPLFHRLINWSALSSKPSVNLLMNPSNRRESRTRGFPRTFQPCMTWTYESCPLILIDEWTVTEKGLNFDSDLSDCRSTLLSSKHQFFAWIRQLSFRQCACFPLICLGKPHEKVREAGVLLSTEIDASKRRQIKARQVTHTISHLWRNKL